MSNNELNIKQVFKYKLSLYYQSTIVYFIAFVLYVLIRGEFVEDSFTLITKDPILYFFAIIVIISTISLVINIFQNKRLEINNEEICLVSRTRNKCFKTKDVVEIKISERTGSDKKYGLGVIKLQLKTRRRRLLIRLADYEKENELLSLFKEMKSELDNK
ncbi:MAG: hypothetical protein HXY49_08615 [Ignavibacteriaceae bacterium]|nr:hypothetical protein [Ignavibacteriaceae bacterium]